MPRREGWADYFEANDIQYAFFSAANGIALQEERARQEELAALEEASDEDEDDAEDFPGMKIPKSGNKLKGLREESKATKSLPPPRVKSLDDDSDDDDDEDSDDDLARRMRRGMGISLPGSDESPRTRILSVLELEELFLKHAPQGESRWSFSRSGVVAS